MKTQALFRISLVSVILLVLFFSKEVNGQKRIIYYNAYQSGLNSSIDPEPASVKQDLDKWSITLTPLSAEVLNEMFNKSSFNSGLYNFSTSYQSAKKYIIKRKRVPSSKYTRQDILRAGIEYLYETDSIDLNTMIDLEEAQNDLYNTDFRSSYTDSREFTDPVYSPYFINDSYLQVFKIEIQNNSNEIGYWESDFFLSNGGIAVKNLSAEEVKNLLELSNSFSSNKELNLLLYHLDKTTGIPAGNSTVKYICFPAIRFETDLTKVSIEGVESTFEFDFNPMIEEYSNKVRYYSFDFNFKFGNSFYPTNDVAISVAPGTDAFISGTDLIVSEKEMDNEIFIYAAGVNSYNYGSVFFCTARIKAGEFLDWEKRKREQIPLLMRKLTGFSIEE